MEGYRLVRLDEIEEKVYDVISIFTDLFYQYMTQLFRKKDVLINALYKSIIKDRLFMIKTLRKNLRYSEIILEVTDVNRSAIACYEKARFKEYARRKQKFAKQAGFKERIYMKLTL